MRHSVNKIISKPEDYNICAVCTAINWYENKYCVSCQSNMSDDADYILDPTFEDLLNDLDGEYELEV